MDADQIIEKLRFFLRKYVGDKHIDLNQGIFSKGLVNSLLAMQLVLFIEKEFAIKVENCDLDLKNFNSIQATVDFIQHKHTAVSV